MEKQINLSLLVGLLIVFSFGFLSATAVTLADPATSGGETGNFTWNITIGGADGGAWGDVQNCSLYLRSTSTANSTYVKVDEVNNASVNETYFFGSFTATANLEDSNDYSVYASCINQTTYTQNSTASTSVFIDTSTPSTATSLTPSTGTTDSDGSVTFYATVTGENTTGCTLYFDGTNPGLKGYTMTHSADNCSYSALTMPEQTFNWLVETSDGNNQTNSSAITVYVDTTPGTHTTPEIVATATGGGLDNTGKTIAIILIIVVTLVVIIKKR